MLLDDAVQAFLLSCRANGLKPKTVRWYSYTVCRFGRSCAGRDVASMAAADLRAYIVGLYEQQQRYENAPQRPAERGALSASTIAGHITALHAFWSWVGREYSLPNPMRNIKRPRRIPPQPKAIAPRDFVRLFDECGVEVQGVRDRALLAFLGDTGCRLGGLIGLTVDRLLLDERRAVVTEKRNLTRIVVYTSYTARLLIAWLAIRPTVTEYVFTSMHTGKGLTESGVQQVLKRLKTRAGVTGRVNPHSFRHNFARAYLLNGGDVVTLARLLGHRDVNLTASYYAVFSDDELANLHEKYSPLKSMRS